MRKNNGFWSNQFFITIETDYGLLNKRSSMEFALNTFGRGDFCQRCFKDIEDNEWKSDLENGGLEVDIYLLIYECNEIIDEQELATQMKLVKQFHQLDLKYISHDDLYKKEYRHDSCFY